MPPSPAEPESHRDDSTLQLLRSGDPEGLRRLIAEHGPSVRAHLTRKFRGLLDAWQLDEAMSLAAVRAWQSAPRFDPELGRLRAWYAVIARNCALSLLAQHRGDPLVPIDDVGIDALGATCGRREADRMRLIVDVHRAIERLSSLQRRVLLADMNAGATLPAPLLAERFRSTARSIYVARARGRRKLRQRLEKLGYGDLLRRTQQPKRDGTKEGRRT